MKNTVQCVKLLAFVGIALFAAAQNAFAGASVEITGYDFATRKATIKFSGLDRDMSLVAVADRTDKGTNDLSLWASSFFAGAIHADVESLTWRLPGAIDTIDGAVRFVLLDLGGARVESISADARGAVIAFSGLLGDLFRKVTVTSFDAKSGLVSLSFSNSWTSNLLYVARADYDCGSDPHLWPSRFFIAEVPAAADSLTCRIPSSLIGGQGVLRFFLSRWTDQQPFNAIESLTSSGSAWINTKIKPDATTAISVVSKQDAITSCAFGIKGCFYFFNTYEASYSRPNYYYGYGDKSGNNDTLSADFYPGKKRSMRLGPDGAFINDTRVSSENAFAGSVFPETDGIALFCRVDSTGTVIDKNGRCTIYSAQIEKGGKLVRDLVPCVDNGIAKMFDRVTGEYLENCGSGEFTQGPAVPSAVDNVESSVKMSVGCPSVSFKVGQDNVMRVKVGPSAGRGVLYAACDNEDLGLDFASWTNRLRLGVVEAADDMRTVNYNLPTEWQRNKAKKCRVFYVYDEENVQTYEVDCIANIGSDWIRTGIAPDKTTAISIVSKQDEITACAFGIAGSFYFFNINEKSYGKPDYYYGYGDKSGSNDTLSKDFFPGEKRMMRLGPDGAYINDTRVSSEMAFEGATFPETDGIALFCRVDSTGTKISKSGQCTIYSAQIEKGGNVVRDFVPFVKEGSAQMYDRVSGAFFENQGSGKFVAGERKARPIEDFVFGCSPCRVICPGLVLFVR